ncbi:MAG: 2-oxoglutarate dehydrogenase complex dihydrolipoyllysine-residue succinyltransferase [Phycisphaeraceae bacterium]
MSVELVIPQVGESITEALIGKWLKKAGDHVEKDEPIVELETDKVTVELPAPVSGTISKQLKAEGEKANIGEVIGTMEEGAGSGGGGGGVSAPASASAKPERTPPAKPQQAQQRQGEPRIMPAAKRELAQNNLAASDVEPTGPGGRLLKEDVQRHAAAAPQPLAASHSAAPSSSAAAPPSRDGAPARLEELTPMTPIRKRTAQRLVMAQQTAALLTTFNECDMSAVMALRTKYKEAFEKAHGVKLGFMSFFVKAVVEGLRAFPRVNSEIRGEDIVSRNYQDIGIAVSTERGLLVPIIRSAADLTFASIEKTIADFGARAKANKIKLDELEGGTFTITNGGIFGSLLSTPIVNPPQSGVLGMHAIQERPIAHEGQVVIRPMMYLALTYDHRIVDGREAVSFLKRVKDVIEDPSRALLEL